MKRELYIYFSVLVILSLLMHYESWFLNPIEHLKNLPKSGAYGFGVYHPFVFSGMIYFILLIPRLIFGFFRNKKREDD